MAEPGVSITVRFRWRPLYRALCRAGLPGLATRLCFVAEWR